MTGPDKRRYHRLNFELPATFKGADDQKHLSIGTTLDVSALGICMVSKEKLKKDQVLKVSVQLPDGETVLINVQVVWVSEDDHYKNQNYKIGLKVVDSLQDDEAKFIRFYAHEFLDFYEKNPEE